MPKYIEIIADTVGKLAGLTVTFVGGAAIAITTAVLSTAAGITTAGMSKYNQFQDPDNEAISPFNESLEAAKNVAYTGYNVFERSSDLLFTGGHTVGYGAVVVSSKAVNTTCYALGKACDGVNYMMNNETSNSIKSLKA